MTEQTSQNQPSGTQKTIVHAKMPKGLIATGLLTIVGSWVGMAVYMNQRLDAVEHQLIGESGKLSQSLQDNQSVLSKQVSGIEDSVLSKVSDTSSVLAKGILDLTKNEETRHVELTAAVNSNLEILKNHRKEIEALLKQSGDKQIETLSGLIAALSEKTGENSQAVMAAIKNMETQVGHSVSQLNDSAMSLQELVDLGQAQRSQLNELATVVSALNENKGASSKQFDTKLTALANQVDAFKNELYQSQESVRKLNQMVPQWKSSTDEYFEGLSEKTQAINSSLESKVNNLQSRIASLDKNIENTSQTVMKALFMSSQGMEGANMDLRTDMATMKDDTTKELQNLNESLALVSATLDDLKSKIENGKTTSFSAFQGSPEFQEVLKTLQQFSSRTVALRAELKSQLEEANTRLNQWDKTAGAVDTQSIQAVLNELGRYMNDTDDQIDRLEISLQSFRDVASQPSDTTASTDQGDDGDSSESKTIGLNTEEKTN